MLVASHHPTLPAKLLVPPGMALVLLYVGYNSMRATSPGGVITPGNRKLMRWGTLAFFVFFEILFWNQDILAFWRADPLGFTAALLLFGWIVYYVAAKWAARQRRAQQIPAVHYEFRQTGLGLEASVTPSPPGSKSGHADDARPARAPQKDRALRIRQAIVLIWAALGLAGGLIAILLHLLRKH